MSHIHITEPALRRPSAVGFSAEGSHNGNDDRQPRRSSVAAKWRTTGELASSMLLARRHEVLGARRIVA
eukprot:CAMPEP_0174877128 /NCGR_PEP_ID=MMETSP1114-20130205/81383_1 /TAXON_ID=312471 /ORGANISM="Neobodo designis, Strain CCAP 1951/1" /LENGTH=68 /DNA_ID=CAMNT_0016112505 /DNA_START=71 /DNA_END=274 /DNA_ORIENTATION=+